MRDTGLFILLVRVRSVFLLVTVFILSSCATIDFKNNLSSAKLCCDDYQGMTFKNLEQGGSVSEIVGDQGSPYFIFPDGKSFYLPIKLPIFEKSYEIQIMSSPTSNQVFVPKILLLNAAFEPVKTIGSDKFYFSKGQASHKFFINEDTGYRYMVLYAAPADVGKKGKYQQMTVSSTPIYGGGYVFYYHSARDEQRGLVTSNGGQTTVRAIPYKLRTLGGE